MSGATPRRSRREECGAPARCAARRGRRPRQPMSWRHLDAPPERDHALDVGGSRLGIAIEPGSIGVFAAIDHEAVVAGGAFPMAFARGVAGPEIGGIHRLGRKVGVAFDRFDAVGAGDHPVVPNSFRHWLVSTRPRTLLTY